jgi:hypothetical protein
MPKASMEDGLWTKSSEIFHHLGFLISSNEIDYQIIQHHNWKSTIVKIDDALWEKLVSPAFLSF